MTTEQKQAYLEDPNHCPFCDAGNIAAGEESWGSFGMNRSVECLQCEKTWIDVYHIVDVVEDVK